MSRNKKSRGKTHNINAEGNISKALKQLEDQKIALELEQMSILHKAMNGGTPLDMLHAANMMSGMGKTQKDGQRQTYTFDSSAISLGQGYKESPTQITDNFLRGMARAPFVRGVIDTRQNQLSNFSRPTIDRSVTGWTIRKKAGLFDENNDERLTPKEKIEISAIVKFVQNCGITDENGSKPENKYDMFTRPTFDSFLRETVRDSLTLDNLAFECISNRRGDLHGFVSVDGSTIRYADERMYLDSYGKPKPEFLQYGQYPMYVQTFNSSAVAQFYSWEMCLGIRNKNTDYTLNGYGVSELEDLTRIVTWQLFGDQYNGKFFSQGAAPKGILKISGNVNQDRLNEFRMYWQQMVTGVANAWRTPVLESDKIEWIDLQKSNQDMQFQNWAEYLIRIICAVFKIDPSEMGFMFKGGEGGNVNTSHKQRTDYSKDKGLVPIMRFYEEILNRWILSRIGDKYEFAWTGLTTEDESESLDMDVKKVANIETVNEVRARRKMPLLPPEQGDIILNPIFLQNLQMGKMGNPQSNEAFNNDNPNPDAPNPFDQSGGSDNPFDKGAFNDVNDWIKAGMPATLERISK